MNVSQINRAILALDSLDDVRSVISACKHRFSELQARSRIEFRIGHRVMFADKRRGVMVEGTIVKINLKTIKVKSTTGVTWTVSPSLLERA